MQRSGTTTAISMFTTADDRSLWSIQNTLEQSYWVGKEGVFEFQFVTDDQPLTNVVGTIRFNLIRYTPDVFHDAFILAIPGRLNGDGSFEYGGGRKGMLINGGNTLMWNDNIKWDKVMKVDRARSDVLDLPNIRRQAKLDDFVMGNIENRYYW